MPYIRRKIAFLVMLVAMAFCFWPSLSLAQSPVVLTDSQQSYPVGRHLQILEDPDGQLTLEQVTSPEYDRQFVPSKVQVPIYGFTTSVYWVRFQVKNEANPAMHWRLVLAHTNMQIMDFYLPKTDGTGFDHKRTGTLLAFSTRDVPDPRLIFELPLPVKEAPVTIYLRFESGARMMLPLSIWSSEALARDSQSQQFSLGFFYGILVIMCGYNFFLFLALREKSYLHFVLFLFSFIFRQLSYEGVGQQYFWPHLVGWASYGVPFWQILSMMAATKFAQTFLDTKSYAARGHQLLNLHLGVMLLLLLLIPLRNYYWVVYPLQYLQLSYLAVIVGVALYSWWQGYRPARYFLLAWAIYFVTTFIQVLASLRIIPATLPDTASIAVMLLVLLLSFALADRINVIKEEKEAAQKEAITNLEEAHQLKSQFVTELEQQVARRTSELEVARHKADIANQAKSSFLANMSHELRSPLNAILGFTQIMVGSRTLPAEHRENVGIINRSGEHLLTLINNVLDLSKIEAGQVTLNNSNFDLYQLLDDVQEMFQLKADDKKLYLVFEREAHVPQFIQTDQVKLRQVLINLLNNALKFTKEGGVTVQVMSGELGIKRAENEAFAQRLPPNSTLRFSVADTGVGIKPDEVEAIFETFVQTESGRHAREGTGLGLPISRRFVQLMGGEIQVESQVGHGTTFSFDVKVQLISAADVDTLTPLQRVIGVEANQPRYRVLIVDDKWTNRQLLVRLLTPLEFELREAEEGQQAVAMWQEWRPDLIWMDMRMPVMDGYEATKQIKDLDTERKTVIIALTASILEEERVTVLAAGCDDFMRKPFKEIDIFVMMSKHLGVRYLYEETNEVSHDPLTAAAVAAVPMALRQRLVEAVDLADMQIALEVLREIETQHTAVAHGLRQLVNNFDYDGVLAFIQQAETFNE